MRKLSVLALAKGMSAGLCRSVLVTTVLNLQELHKRPDMNKLCPATEILHQPSQCGSFALSIKILFVCFFFFRWGVSASFSGDSSRL